ncbi:MAG: hypothetical protein JW934_00945 [Anaerolineae bacterium]|nr:hypothetical protein [Anaerolineae bacterium]
MSETTDSAERAVLTQVNAALCRGDKSGARALLEGVLKGSPRSIAAWSWACQAAETDQERIVCLQHILEIDPDHGAAQRYLAQLTQIRPPLRGRPQSGEPNSSAPAAAPFVPSPIAPSTPRPRFADRLLALLYFLFGLPTGYLIGAIAVVGLLVVVVYSTVNHDWFGLAEPEWDRLTISPSIETIQSDRQTWQIAYERSEDSRFAGLVRHASLIRFDRVPFLTHDILVTSGDYADPEQVRTTVIDHHFSWRSSTLTHPQGAINLLHTVAVSPDVFHQLLQIRNQDQVVIVGREILSIRVYNLDGVYLGDWHDTGCNTLLVRSVEIVSR